MHTAIALLPPRLQEKVTEKPNGCWEWTGTLNNGRPYISWKGTRLYAHRLIGQMLNGYSAFPPGHHTKRHCDNIKCVNPEHYTTIEIQNHNYEA